MRGKTLKDKRPVLFRLYMSRVRETTYTMQVSKVMMSQWNTAYRRLLEATDWLDPGYNPDTGLLRGLELLDPARRSEAAIDSSFPIRAGVAGLDELLGSRD